MNPRRCIGEALGGTGLPIVDGGTAGDAPGDGEGAGAAEAAAPGEAGPVGGVGWTASASRSGKARAITMVGSLS